jgi:membrane-bound ClpP family serine protease
VTTLQRYLLFQVPGWLLVSTVVFLLFRSAVVSRNTALVLVALWVVKDLVLYPMFKGAYRKQHNAGDAGLIGLEAVAVDGLDPSGFVRVRGERWRARVAPGAAPIAAGTRVRVLAVEGLTLTVTAAEATGS